MKRYFEARPSVRLDRLVDEAIARHGLIADGDSILVGVSGGADSVALLHLLAARASEGRLRLGVAHLDHGLRPESERDAGFVRAMAAGLGLDVYVERVEVAETQRRWRLSLEEAARRARYDFLQSTAARHGYVKVALGHHADDNAETLLLNLLRGSGRLGLGGIRAIREGVYIRPLIRATRSDIEQYLQVRKLPFRTDRTNSDTAILRNRIRHRLLPLLESDYRAGVRTVLSRTAEVLADEEDWIEGLLRPDMERMTTACGQGRLTLAAADFGRMPLAAARRIARAAVRRVQGDLRRIGSVHVEQIIHLSRRRGAAGPLYLPGDVRVRVEGAELVFERRTAESMPALQAAPLGDFEYTLSGCGALFIRETGDRFSLRGGPESGGAADGLSGPGRRSFPRHRPQPAARRPLCAARRRRDAEIEKIFQRSQGPGRGAAVLPAARQRRPHPVGVRLSGRPAGTGRPSHPNRAKGRAIACETTGCD